MAIVRFCDCERVACDLTTMPVGLWMSWTAELVLFFGQREKKSKQKGNGEKSEEIFPPPINRLL